MRDRIDFGALLTAAALLVFVVAVSSATGSSALRERADLAVIAAFAVAIAGGEYFRLVLAGTRESAPMSMAAAFAFAMTSEVTAGARVSYGAQVVTAVTAVAMLGGAVPHLVAGAALRVEDMAGRFLSVAVAAVLFREVPFAAGQTLMDAQSGRGSERWLTAIWMVLVSATALVVNALLNGAATAAREHVPLRQAIVDEFRLAAGLSAALVATGALIALAERPLGIVALPLFLVPLVLTQFAVRRYYAVRETYLQTIRTLSRLTEHGGYTPPGHPARVAETSVAVGRDLGMSERDALTLEYAALLHDIGQVALREPIPGGATVMAAPTDQDRIALDGAEIVRKTGVLDDVAATLAGQAKPFRQVRELGEELPLASRIIKVVNAFDDLVGESTDPRRADAAIERIHLGLGYEYDPRVVDSLTRVLARRGLREGSGAVPPE